MADDGKREIWATLEPSTYRDVPFQVQSISVSGGRKANARPILNSSEQVVDDVGLQQRVYSVRGYVSAQYKKANASAQDTLDEIEAETEARRKREAATGVQEEGPIEIGKNVGRISSDYREHRAALTAAFEAEGSGAFVHPIEGRIENLIVKSFQIDETMNDVGVGRVTVEFVRETTTPIPKPVAGAKESVKAAADAADAAAKAEIANNLKTSKSFVGSIASAGEKIGKAYDKALAVAETVETVTDAMDQFQRDIAKAQASVFSIVGDAISVADSINGVFSSINSLFALPSAAFQALQNGFDFGDLDVSFDFSTPSGKQKKRNFDALNTANKCQYLTGAYRAALDLDYVTTDDISTVEGILEAQHSSIVEGDAASDCLKDSLTLLRESFFDFLAGARLNARSLVQAEATTTTPRVLSYMLYDNVDDTETLAGLNGAAVYENISGSVTVLSR